MIDGPHWHDDILSVNNAHRPAVGDASVACVLAPERLGDRGTRAGVAYPIAPFS
jgi:hypothetical protein